MSQLIRHLNQIKNKRTKDSLNPSQQLAFLSINNALRIPSTVNLFGQIGTGKTYLSWILAGELNFAYLPHPNQISHLDGSKHEGVIIDNCLSERKFHRELLKTVQLYQFNRAIFITRHMINDYTYFVELKLTVKDILAVQNNLINIGILLTPDETTPPNLWYLVNSFL